MIGLEPIRAFGPRDFKSLASTYSATSARRNSRLSCIFANKLQSLHIYTRLLLFLQVFVAKNLFEPFGFSWIEILYIQSTFKGDSRLSCIFAICKANIVVLLQLATNALYNDLYCFCKYFFKFHKNVTYFLV